MNRKHLPGSQRFTERLLKRFFPDDGIFTTIGDLEEVLGISDPLGLCETIP